MFQNIYSNFKNILLLFFISMTLSAELMKHYNEPKCINPRTFSHHGRIQIINYINPDVIFDIQNRVTSIIL